MAMIRKASDVRKKLHMLIYGEQGTGKSRTAMQLCYLKNADGKPFRVLYLDTENGSIDNYTEELEANGVNPDNLLIVYTQSLAEVQDYIKMVTNNEDIEDENGDVYLDADGKPFRADALVVDSASILKMTATQGLTAFSQKRAKVKAASQGLTGDEKAVKIEGAGMELKDFNTLNFKGQSLILDLNASGVNYIVICREKDEKHTKVVNGSIVSEPKLTVALPKTMYEMHKIWAQGISETYFYIRNIPLAHSGCAPMGKNGNMWKYSDEEKGIDFVCFNDNGRLIDWIEDSFEDDEVVTFYGDNYAKIINAVCRLSLNQYGNKVTPQAQIVDFEVI